MAKKVTIYLVLATLLVLVSGVARAAPPVPGLQDMGYEVIAASVTIPENVILGSVTANCSAGKVVLGGGARLVTGTGFEQEHSGIRESRPLGSNNGWTASSFGEQNNQVRTLTAWAICANG
jgi:hypothetical protein